MSGKLLVLAVYRQIAVLFTAAQASLRASEPQSCSSFLSEITRVNSNVGLRLVLEMEGPTRTRGDTGAKGQQITLRNRDCLTGQVAADGSMALCRRHEWLLHSLSLEEFKCCTFIDPALYHTLEPLGEIEAS